jgi:hypothetical protein
MNKIPGLDNTNQSQTENIFKNYSIVVGREEGMLQRIGITIQELLLNIGMSFLISQVRK